MRKTKAKQTWYNGCVFWVEKTGRIWNEWLKKFEHTGSIQRIGQIKCRWKKRLEYEARQKAIRDKNILLKTGETRGIEKGTQATLERLILSMLKEQLPLDKIFSITGILISIPESLYFYYHMFYRTYILLCVFRIHSFENSLILLFHTQLCRKCFCFFHYNFAECK